MLDQHLADHEHVSGARLSLADIALATPLTAIGPAKLPVEGRTNVLRWFERVSSLPAWRAATRSRDGSQGMRAGHGTSV